MFWLKHFWTKHFLGVANQNKCHQTACLLMLGQFSNARWAWHNKGCGFNHHMSESGLFLPNSAKAQAKLAEVSFIFFVMVSYFLKCLFWNWKNFPEWQIWYRDISKNASNFDGLECRFWTVFFVITWDSVHIFQKPIFALKPWDWADRFEYPEPYNRNDFFSHGAIKYE